VFLIACAVCRRAGWPVRDRGVPIGALALDLGRVGHEPGRGCHDHRADVFLGLILSIEASASGVAANKRRHERDVLLGLHHEVGVADATEEGDHVGGLRERLNSHPSPSRDARERPDSDKEARGMALPRTLKVGHGVTPRKMTTASGSSGAAS
jgi:hypothetical protein